MQKLIKKSFFFNDFGRFAFSSMKIKEIKNNCMLVVNDQNKELPYMAQIQTEQGQNGIVMKIDQNGDTYIGMYEPFVNSTSLDIKEIHKSWKKPFNKITQAIINHQNNCIFDVNSNIIFSSIKKTHNNQSKQQQLQFSNSQPVYNGTKRRIKSASPILNICNDMYYGDMISFLGCRGSKKTSTAVKIINQFNNPNAISIYLNPQFREAKQVINKRVNNTYAFSVSENQNPTDIGVYMLTLKTISLCNKLKEQGLDVLLVVDNFKEILTREWNYLQTIRFESRQVKNTSASFQYNSIKIPPISILNEIFSSCNDQNSSHSIKKTNRKGSFTSLVLSQHEQRDEVVQSITSYTNNIKHLITLSNTIEFPVDIKTIKNSYNQLARAKINSSQHDESQHRSSITSKPEPAEQVFGFLRKIINEYQIEKKDSELKRSLYKNDIRDAPWDYYHILDSEWWIKGLKQVKPSSFYECKNICFWIKFNMQKDIISQWNITAKQSYTKFTQFLLRVRGDLQTKATPFLQFTKEDMQQFLQQAKMEGLLNPFKKDYLL